MKKTMKWGVVTALGLALSVGQMAWAAPAKTAPSKMGAMKGKRGGMRGGGPMRMMKDLNLTEAQKTKIKAITMASQPKMKALRDNKTLAEKDRRAAMMKIRKADMVKINAILTPAQRAKMATMQKEMREKMKNRKPGDRPGQPKM